MGNIKHILEERKKREQWLIDNITTFEDKKELVLKPLHDITGKNLDGSDIIDIRNESELQALHGVLYFMFSYNAFVYEDISSNQTINRERERYERIKKEYFEMANLMRVRSNKRHQGFLEFETDIMDIPYTPPQSESKGFKYIRQFLNDYFINHGFGINRAKETTSIIIDYLKNNTIVKIRDDINCLFEIDIFESISTYEEKENIEIEKYFHPQHSLFT